MPGNKVDSLGVPTLNDSIAFYTLWEKAGQQSWFPGSAHIQRFYYVLHASKKCQVTKLIPWECQYWTCVLCFTRFERMPGDKVESPRVPHSMFLLCFTGFGRMPGNKVDSLGVPAFNVSIAFYTLGEDAGSESWVPGSAHIQRFYCVLHALRWCRVTELFPWECPHSTFLCVLHALRGCRVTKLIPWECPHSTFLLCFACFERMPGNKVDSLEFWNRLRKYAWPSPGPLKFLITATPENGGYWPPGSQMPAQPPHNPRTTPRTTPLGGRGGESGILCQFFFRTPGVLAAPLDEAAPLEKLGPKRRLHCHGRCYLKCVQKYAWPTPEPWKSMAIAETVLTLSWMLLFEIVCKSMHDPVQDHQNLWL
jgi:hypothetical protein